MLKSKKTLNLPRKKTRNQLRDKFNNTVEKVKKQKKKEDSILKDIQRTQMFMDGSAKLTGLASSGSESSPRKARDKKVKG